MSLKKIGGGGGSATIFGDGSDGNITRSSSTNESGLLFSETYHIQSGAYCYPNDGWVMIFAKKEIIIDGELDATGRGAPGNTGDNGSGNDPNDYLQGTQGLISPQGSGGSGGNAYRYGDGGNGGDGDMRSSYKLADFFKGPLSAAIQEFLSNPEPLYAGAGGGKGGVGDDRERNRSGSNGRFPGGGGGGGFTNSMGSVGGINGGNGGDGGGLILLASPKITINGEVKADGQDGNNGNSYLDAGGGGGGGGSGGGVVLFGNEIQNNGTISANGGLGGLGGNQGAKNPGGDGADGADGVVSIITTE